MFHKKLKKHRKTNADSGVHQQRTREAAEEQARDAAQSGDEYQKLLAEGLRYHSEGDYRKAGKAFREAIALRPDEPTTYLNLGAVLANSGHYVEAAQRYLDAKERYPVGSERWAESTAMSFETLMQEVCDEVAKPEWWNDQALKALSARVVRASPNHAAANKMRATMMSGRAGHLWGAGPRSAAELKEAVTHYERAAALANAPVMKAELKHFANVYRGLYMLRSL